MEHYETIIVGGGPAGSSCARALKKEGREVLILDKKEFPRLKLCAGWITPQILRDLEFSPEDYPHAILPLEIRSYIMSLPFPVSWFPVAGPNYSIRRVEFDEWLLKRSGTESRNQNVKKIERIDGRYILDDKYSCEYLVGAGGSMCPIRKKFFPDIRKKENQLATLEKEFEYPARKEECFLFFFYKGLKGYSWYVPKGDGFVNIGIGGYSKYFKKSGTNIHDHFKTFLDLLVKRELLDPETAENLNETGHSYFLANCVEDVEVKKDNVFLIGDSVGMATVDLGEGIGPAVESGITVAKEIMGLDSYELSKIEKFSSTNKPFRWVAGKVLI